MGRARPRPTTALCCECGNNLTFDIGEAHRRSDSGPWKGEACHAVMGASFDFIVQETGEPLAPPRCTVLLACPVCETKTRHAYLRDDVDRDMFESQLMHEWDGWNVLTPSSSDEEI